MENITEYVNSLCYRHRELLQEDCTNTDEFFNLTSELQLVYGLEPDAYGFFALEQLEKPFVTVCYLERLEEEKPIIKWSVEKDGQPIGIYKTRIELQKIQFKTLRQLEEFREQKTKQLQDRMEKNSLSNRYKDIDPKKKEKTPEEKRKLRAEGMVKWSAKMQAKRGGNYNRFKR